MLILPGEIRRELIMDEYFAVEGLGELLVQEADQLGLGGGEDSLVRELVGRDHEGALGTGVAVEKIG